MRRVVVILLLLLTGALVNVAVAWGAASRQRQADDYLAHVDGRDGVSRQGTLQIAHRAGWPMHCLANTLVFATTFLLAFAGPGCIRRALRRRHGVCPKCRYPVGESDVCTECGMQLRHVGDAGVRKTPSRSRGS